MRTAAAMILCLGALAQQPASQGGGAITIGGKPHRFEPRSLVVTESQGKQVYLLEGILVPHASKSLYMKMTLTSEGRIMMLDLQRTGGPGVIRDHWGATLKTQAKILQQAPYLGDVLRIHVSGPLTGVRGHAAAT